MVIFDFASGHGHGVVEFSGGLACEIFETKRRVESVEKFFLFFEIRY